MQLSMQFAILFNEILNLFNLKILLYFPEMKRKQQTKVVTIYLCIKGCKETNIFNEKMGRRSA